MNNKCNLELGFIRRSKDTWNYCELKLLQTTQTYKRRIIKVYKCKAV